MTFQFQISSNNSTWSNLYPNNTNSPYTVYNYLSNSFYRYMRCIVKCGNYRDTSQVLTIPYENPKKCYCNVAAPSTLSQDIGNVTLNGFSNGTAQPMLNNSASVNVHTDFTSLPPVTLTQGFVYPLSVTQINYAEFHRSKVKVYVDFNGNQNYYDVGEEFLIGITSDSSSTPGKVTANLSIPYNDDTGITGMRIMLGEKIYKNTLFPCEISTEAPTGEVEDYLVNIVPNNACTLPVAGNAVAPIDRYCAKDSV
ncbi:MAG: GEVED domain-containing protein, partial [Flavobacterium sp.]